MKIKSTVKRASAAIAFVLAGALSLSACGGGSSATATKGTAVADTITAQVAYASRDYHPSSTTSALTMAANWHVVEPLYAFDYSDYSTFNALAKDEPKEISETEYEVTLRDGAKFSDGKAVTSNDVVKSYERTTAEGSTYAPMLSFIDSVTAKDDTTVTFKLKQTFPMFKQRLAILQIVEADASDADLKAQPIGSGPYKYSKISDTQVKFVKNDLYNGSYKAQATNMIWNVTVDDTPRVTAMQGGKTDVMEMVPANAFTTLKNSGSELQTKQGYNEAMLMFNTKKKPFNDKRVRQAILYAVDVDKLVKNQMSGQAEAATSYVPSTSESYNKASTVYTKNVAKAKELLKEAGVSDLSFTLYSTNTSWIAQLAPQIKNDLAEIGVKVDIESQASAALYPAVVDGEDPSYSVLLASGDPSVFGNDSDLLMNWFYGDNMWQNTRSFWKTTEPDQYNKLHDLMNKAIAASSDDERQQYWNQCYDLISEEAPIYPLLFRKTTTAVRKGSFSSYNAMATTGLDLVKAKVNK